MKISVALCTYNGARFIEEQLRSLANQTRHPDELVVCDDGSVDATLEIVSAFAKRSPFSVHCSRNEIRLGVTKNFERAVSRCTGDLIFLCDQDDVWLPDKIRTLASVFEGDAGVGLVFSDAVVADAQLEPCGYTMWQTIELSPAQQRLIDEGQALDILLRRCVVTGATLAFRAALRQRILPIPASSLHDAWIAAVSAMHSRIIAVRVPLVLYRQHDANVIGGVRMTRVARLRDAMQLGPDWFDLEIARLRSLLDKMCEGEGRAIHREHVANLERRIAHLESRRAMYDLTLLPRLSRVTGELVSRGYADFSGGWKAAVVDVIAKGKWRRVGLPP